MIKLFGNGCPQCKMIKIMLDNKKIAYEEISDENIILEISSANNIMSMPFAEIDGAIVDTNELKKYTYNYKTKEI